MARGGTPARPAQISTTARGREAERRVAAVLVDRGYVILGLNVRVGRDELDIVAMDGTVLVVVEVRSRAPGSLGDPLETVSATKAARLRRAALRYMAQNELSELRIDLAAVRGREVEILENALDFTTT